MKKRYNFTIDQNLFENFVRFRAQEKNESLSSYLEFLIKQDSGSIVLSGAK